MFMTDINECLSANNCDPIANCVNTNGNYTCNCPSGYKGSGNKCYSKSFIGFCSCFESSNTIVQLWFVLQGNILQLQLIVQPVPLVATLP